MGAPLITKEQLENRLSKLVLDRIYDDDGTGEANSEPVDALIRDASSKVRGKLGPVYNPDVIDENTNAEVTRITLDVAVAYAYQRHPEIARADWEAIMKQADKELAEIRTGLANLGTNAPPEPAANVGGALYADDGGDEPKRFFTDDGGTGVF